MTDDVYPHANSRREFLKASLLSCGLVSIGAPGALGGGLPAVPANLNAQGGMTRVVGPERVGALLPADANGLRLPSGFASRVLARSRQPVAGSDGYIWHDAPDGGATFPTANGWIYVSNCERSSPNGGASALRFDSSGDVIGAYSICSGSARNCAGGPTPWGTWLTCEEVDLGRVIECDPTGARAPIVRNALGWFQHEAAAVDPATGDVYLTEDERDGGFYRFRPNAFGDLSAGVLEIALLSGRRSPYAVSWNAVAAPNPTAGGTRTRKQVRKSFRFNGGEGAWHHQGVIYMTTKGDNRVWAFDIARAEISIIYDDATSATPVLTGVDNVTVSQNGSVYVAEDGGDMQICVIGADRSVAPIVMIEGHSSSEVTGVAFSPDGARLYFSSQSGATGAADGGVTYEVTGPFATV
jgi:hypothetical protein